MSTPDSVADALVKMALRSGEGVRVTLSDSRGPVVSVWEPSAGAAWQQADILDRLRTRNPHRVVSMDRRLAS